MAEGSVRYQDRWITCTDTHVVIHGYYFPTGASKSVRYTDIRSVTLIEMAALAGKWRLWGSASLYRWWHLDLNRPRKRTALLLDLGRRVKPVITPVDASAVKQLIEERCSIPDHGDREGAGPPG